MTDTHELNRRIAGARGWRSIQGNHTNLSGLMGIPPEEKSNNHYRVPDWATDANAAFELLADMNEHGEFGHGDYNVSYQPYGDDGPCWWCGHVCDNFDFTAPTPAMAICRAWLKWHKAQEPTE